MLILMGLLPAGFALQVDGTGAALERTLKGATHIEQALEKHGDPAGAIQVAEARALIADVRQRLDGRGSVAEIPAESRFPIRQDILLVDRTVAKLVDAGHLGLNADEKKALDTARKDLRSLTEYAPTWVLVAIALALGIGTMVGWKRIVVTVGEKIGKAHLTYAQGMSAEIVAASAIGFASFSGLPVSTTHVLSSGIAGTMVAQKSGLNVATVRTIAAAWVLTLPVSMLLSGGLYLLFRAFVG
jgi:PiT family inorganic phosphate transporter